MADPVADTIAWYDRHAANFAEQTGGLNLAPLYDRFLRHVRPGGRILDAGCGVGRDSLVFAERGCNVVAFDASEEMVRLARERVGGRATVRRMRFEDVAWRGEFDGIWACASLLHVPPAFFLNVASRLADALRPGGAWYMSFKVGKRERMNEGRLFVDRTQETLGAALQDLPVEAVDAWMSADIRPARGTEHWLHFIAAKQHSSEPDAS